MSQTIVPADVQIAENRSLVFRIVIFPAGRLVIFHAFGFGAFPLEFRFPVQNLGKFLAAA